MIAKNPNGSDLHARIKFSRYYKNPYYTLYYDERILRSHYNKYHTKGGVEEEKRKTNPTKIQSFTRVKPRALHGENIYAYIHKSYRNNA